MGFFPKLTRWVTFLFATVTCVSAHAVEHAGTVEDPFPIDDFPYAHAGTTIGAPSNIPNYTCASTTNEGGPERLYRLELQDPGRLLAWVEGDSSGAVDIDVHLVDVVPTPGGTASCAARGNRWAEADLLPGVYWISVDTYRGTGAELPGPYELLCRLHALRTTD